MIKVVLILKTPVYPAPGATLLEKRGMVLAGMAGNLASGDVNFDNLTDLRSYVEDGRGFLELTRADGTFDCVRCSDIVRLMEPVSDFSKLARDEGVSDTLKRKPINCRSTLVPRPADDDEEEEDEPAVKKEKIPLRSKSPKAWR